MDIAGTDGLDVWCGARRVGGLWRNPAGVMGFRYHERWLQEGGMALSQQLPLRAERFGPEDGGAHRFFANLLPEAGARATLVRSLKVADTDFDLLRAIGGECAGAFSVLPVGQAPSAEHAYQALSEEDLRRLVLRRGHSVAAAVDAPERLRLSLAGAQHKCPVLVKDGGFWLPLNEAPSSHILKFELADYRNVPAFEAFTTMLAGAIGLPVVDVELHVLARKRFIVIERYDRQRDQAGGVVRLHQEDFCQALGFGDDQKYEADGGLSFADCYRLVQRASSEPAQDLPALLRWQAFNLLAGNSDGHAKNLSLLYLPDGGTRLAPFYDLVCTRALAGVDHSLALFIGGEKEPGLVGEAHWRTLAEACGLKPAYVLSLIAKTAKALQQRLPEVRAAFEGRYGAYPALQRVERVIRRQQRRMGGLLR